MRSVGMRGLLRSTQSSPTEKLFRKPPSDKTMTLSLLSLREQYLGSAGGALTCLRGEGVAATVGGWVECWWRISREDEDLFCDMVETSPAAVDASKEFPLTSGDTTSFPIFNHFNATSSLATVDGMTMRRPGTTGIDELLGEFLGVGGTPIWL